MLATIGPFLQLGKIDVDALLTYVLQFGFGIPNAMDFLKKEEPAQQQPGGTPYSGPGGPPQQGLPPGGAGVASVPGGILPPSGGVPESASAPPQNLPTSSY